MRDIMYRLKDGTVMCTFEIHRAFHIFHGVDGYGKYHMEEYNTGEYIRFLNSLFKSGNIVWYGYPTLDEFIKGGNRVLAIKTYRDEHECSLEEAKKYIDSVM